jgi:hypothetical protein
MVDPRQLSRILAGTPGVPAWGDLVLYIDAGDPASLPSTTSPPTTGTIFDITGNVHPHAISLATNPPTITDSHLDFSGSVIEVGQGVARPANTFNLFAGGGTWSFWTKVRSIPGSGVDRFVDTRGGSNNQGYYIAPRGANPTGFQIEFGRNYSITNGLWRIDLDALEQAVPLDRWVNITMTFLDSVGDGNPGTVSPPRIYIDGTEATEVVEVVPPNGTPVSETSAFLRFGARGNGGIGSNDLDGFLDVMAAWSKILSEEEVVQFYAATRARFTGGTGLQLLDRVEVSVPSSSVTLNGLDSARDGIFFVTGKLITSFGFGLYEMRPVPGAALVGIESESGNTFSTALTSSTGWIVGFELFSEPGSATTFSFQAWIYPSKAKFGATGDLAEGRLYTATGTRWRYNGGVIDDLDLFTGWGRWLDSNDDSHFESITINATGPSIAVGSEFSIFKLGQGKDPI